MMLSHKTAPFAAALMCLAATRPMSATDEALQKCLAQAAEQANFSGVMAATETGQAIALLARGTLAGANSAAITAATRFNLASASKMFTAVAIGQLIDAGTVRLDDPIGAFVKDLEPETAAVTIRQLLTHSSGLGDFFKPENMTAMLKARTASDLLPLVAHGKPTFTPGSHFAYSNSGFALLGILIERVSGLRYGDYLARKIFAPAGMTETGLDPKPLATLAVGMTAMRMDRTPSGARGGSEPPVIRPDGTPTAGQRGADPAALSAGGRTESVERPVLHPAPGATEGYGSAAGGLFSTAVDLQRFAEALLDHRLTSAVTTAALTAPQILAVPATPSGPERRYGFGFGVGIENGHQWFGHNGGTLGANAEFAVFPDNRLTLSVLSNRDPPMATRMFAYLRKLALDPSLRASCGTSEGK